MPDAEPIPEDLSSPALGLDATPDSPPPEEPAPVIDIHPAHHAATTWRDFFIHIATIVLGLLIAIGLEQTVELIHHHREAREARASIQNEIDRNLTLLVRNQQALADTQKELAKDLDLLDSAASDAQILPQLDYKYSLQRRQDAAWGAAKIDGSLALISSSQIAHASYFYESTDAMGPVIFAYFTEMDTAEALLNHARATGKLTASDRQRLLPLTVSAMGGNALVSRMFSSEVRALHSTSLE